MYFLFDQIRGIKLAHLFTDFLHHAWFGSQHGSHVPMPHVLLLFTFSKNSQFLHQRQGFTRTV
jgi:hypothetical protein